MFAVHAAPLVERRGLFTQPRRSLSRVVLPQPLVPVAESLQPAIGGDAPSPLTRGNADKRLADAGLFDLHGRGVFRRGRQLNGDALRAT